MTDATPAPQPTPTAQPGATAPTNPGQTMGIVGLVLAIFFNIIGIIVSIVALNKSKKAGFGNGPAVAGIIVGILTTIIAVVIIAGIIATIAAASAGLGQIQAEMCGALGSGTWDLGGGQEVTCP